MSRDGATATGSWDGGGGSDGGWGGSEGGCGGSCGGVLDSLGGGGGRGGPISQLKLFDDEPTEFVAVIVIVPFLSAAASTPSFSVPESTSHERLASLPPPVGLPVQVNVQSPGGEPSGP